MLLLVGLGNPGREYERNRHNIGFMAVDAIVRRHGFGAFRARFDGHLAAGNLDGRRVLAFKPMTYMNDSGRAVGAAVNFYKMPAKDVLVLHDEIDLAAGKIRVKRGGGHAGHNGLRSIHAHIGDGYGRLRLGVGHPGDKGRVAGHVLKDFAKADNEWVEKLLDAVADHVGLLAAGNDANFASRVALDMNPPKHKPKPENLNDKDSEEKNGDGL